MGKESRSSTWKLLIPLAFYFTGFFLIEPTDIEQLRAEGVAEKEEYVYTDSEGEEHEGQTLITVKGLGEVLTYKDVYMSSIPLFILSMIFGKIALNSDNELGCAAFANCIIGVFLLWLTSRTTIISTAMFWAGILSVGFVEND